MWNRRSPISSLPSPDSGGRREPIPSLALRAWTDQQRPKRKRGNGEPFVPSRTEGSPVMEQPRKRISIVTPCYNEQDNVADCYETVRRIFETELAEYDYE